MTHASEETGCALCRNAAAFEIPSSPRADGSGLFQRDRHVTMAFQPIVDAHAAQVVAHEALVRPAQVSEQR